MRVIRIITTVAIALAMDEVKRKRCGRRRKSELEKMKYTSHF
jgi:hypothetical protein